MRKTASDTPRTDAESGEAVFTESGCAADVVNAEFARQLEREAAELRRLLRMLERSFYEERSK